METTTTEVVVPKEEVKISNEAWMQISRELEKHHAIFYKLWQMGKPIFTDAIQTAAVQFDRSGEFVNFLFNPEFWKSCYFYDRLFTICHESLHIILNHGERIQDTLDKEACNKALDIVVNHSLLNNFGFERKRIKDWGRFCWVDTIFKQEDGTIKKDEYGNEITDNECFEYYINQFEQIDISGLLSGDGGKGTRTVDDHEMLGNNDFDDVIDKLDGELSDEEKQSIKDFIEKHKNPKRRGSSETGEWHFIKKKIVPKKKKWETVIKKWSLKYLRREHKNHEQWARLNRRFQFLPGELFLPSEMEVEEINRDKNRIKVFFFLDTSGSCASLADRFFHAADSLPSDRFEIQLFCFNTKVYEVDIKTRELNVGGGTRFNIIESAIQSYIKKKDEKYPEAVFVITDGWGNKVVPTQPERWFWFLSEWKTNLIPHESHKYNLKDFE